MGAAEPSQVVEDTTDMDEKDRELSGGNTGAVLHTQLDEVKQETPPASQVTQHAGLWFDDGQVMIISEDGLSFKLHPGILSRHSAVFANAIEAARLAKPLDAPYPVLNLNKRGADLVDFFEIIYDGGQQYVHPPMHSARQQLFT